MPLAACYPVIRSGEKQNEGAQPCAPSFVWEEKRVPKPSAKPKPSRSSSERRQWATAVVKKATPKIVKSLIEAAASVEEESPKAVSLTPGQEEDEALAAILLRLLRPPDTQQNNGTENTPAPTAAPSSENPSVG